MNRQILDNGEWFDIDKAQKFTEDTEWNGQNHISVATGDQWVHQELWRTKSGRWALNTWSQWQGTLPTWALINKQDAAQWLLVNGHEAPEELAEHYAALEI